MVFELNLGTDSVTHAHPQTPSCVESETSIRGVLAQLQSEQRGCCLICREGLLVGIFTERDAIRLMASGTKVNLDQPIETAMTKTPVAITNAESVASAIATMSRRGFRQLPVVDDQGRPVGIVKAAGILHYLVEHFPHYVYNLPPAPHHTPQQREGA
ncbi:MAG: CBS domain-containing protein [Planctomycetota bacterium]|nr:CBS domain-containing protein [Planctomycetota bacterium]